MSPRFKNFLKTIPVTQRALIQRINRKLKADCRMVKKSRRGRGAGELGDFYIVDFNRNAVVAKHVDLAKLGCKLDVIAGYESLEVAA